MRVYHHPNTIDLDKPVITLGLFDGVHRGHQLLISSLLNSAADRSVEALVVTLWPHPRIVLGKHDGSFTLLSTLEEKLWLLEKFGVKHCWVIRFDETLASMQAEEFIRHYLTGPFIPSGMVIGDDHHFGRNAGGDLQTLKAAGAEHGFRVEHINSHLEGSTRISSSFIRACLSAGDLISANRLLGYPYLMIGQVEEGKKLGRSLGFPTANIHCCEVWKHIPADGVYAVRVDWQDVCYDGMLNIGLRPTIDDHDRRTIEVHLFGVGEDLYGDELRIHFIQRLRDEMRFGSLEELREQLGRDRELALKVLGEWRDQGNSYLCRDSGRD